MKPAKIISVLAPMLALLAGCAGSVQGTDAKAPTQTAKAVEQVEEPLVVLPYDDGPPGSMDYSWEPTEAPPAPEVKPRKLDAKPHLVVPKAQKRKLFVLPTTFSHSN